MDAITEPFETLFQRPRDVLPLALIEVGFALIFERVFINQQVVDDAEDAVRHSDHGLLGAVASCQSPELCGQVCLGPGRGVRGVH